MWISTKDRLPKDGQEVWICIETHYVNAPVMKNVMESVYNGHTFTDPTSGWPPQTFHWPTHWMLKSSKPRAPK